MKFTIIMPTYNEAENIGPMIDKIERIIQETHHIISMLVVDDNSPDGTKDIVLDKKMHRPWLELLSGEKEGLGNAYVRGMIKAINEGVDAIFQMDCDFSHNPQDIPRLIQEIENGFDFIIGSRYVRGGSVPKEWSQLRKMNSLIGNVLARYIAGIYNIKDCTAGFRCIHIEVLKGINLEKIETQGYGFQVTLLHAAYINGSKIKEIPVHFIDRTRGESKLGWFDIAEFAMNAASIRLHSMQNFRRFCLVGTSGVLINLGLLYFFINLPMHLYLASFSSIVGAIAWNFLLNSHWSFRELKTRGGINLQGKKFNIVSLLALILSLSVFIVAHETFKNISPYSAQLLGIVPATFVNYFLNSYWTVSQQPVRN